MYLNKLNNEQKELFLDLCIHAAMANGDFADKEKEMVNEYCSEMNINKIRYVAIESLDDVIVKLIAISTKEEMKMIVLEITALLISDNEFDKFEKVFIEKINNKISLKKAKYEQMLNALNDLSVIYDKINDLIFND